MQPCSSASAARLPCYAELIKLNERESKFPSIVSVSNNSLKPHKIFRGLRCFISHRSEIVSQELVEINIQEIKKSIPSQIEFEEEAIMLFSFGKSKHSVLLIKNKSVFSYIQSASSGFKYRKSTLDSLILNIGYDMARYNSLYVKENSVLITGLNMLKIERLIREKKLSYQYNTISNNCARLCADLLLAGVDNPEGFIHNRPFFQLPANTHELAKEIKHYLQRN